jgi:hypothetical protein
MKTFIDFQHWYERQTGRTIKAFRHDRGKEYLNNEFQDYLKDQGIEDQTTAGYSSESNGSAESHLRILGMIARSMMAHASLPKKYWGSAILTANYIYNRTFIPKLQKTPFEALLNIKPRVDHFRIFGCKCVMYIPSKKRTKMEPTGKICRFVGYGDKSLTYKLWDGQAFKLVESRDVRFFEDCFSFSYKDAHSTQNDISDSSPALHLPLDIHSNSPDDLDSEATDISTTDTEESMSQYDDPRDETFSISSSNTSSESSISNSSKDTMLVIDHKTTRSGSHYFTHQSTKIPNHYKDISKTDNPSDWHGAVTKEIEGITRLQTFEPISLSELPSGTALLKTRWVFKLKEMENGTSIPKARLVVRGDKEDNTQGHICHSGTAGKLSSTAWHLISQGMEKCIHRCQECLSGRFPQLPCIHRNTRWFYRVRQHKILPPSGQSTLWTCGISSRLE